MDATELDPLLLRFYSHVEPEDGCLVWSGTPSNHYAHFRHEDRTIGAHRWLYIYTYGPLPQSIEVRHRCDNPPCVDLLHLVAGSHAENMQDVAERGRGLQHFTHCPHDHEYTPENTRLTKRGYRVCRECERNNHRRYRAARQETDAPNY